MEVTCFTAGSASSKRPPSPAPDPSGRDSRTARAAQVPEWLEATPEARDGAGALKVCPERVSAIVIALIAVVNYGKATAGLFSEFSGFPDSSVGKESTCSAGNPGWIPGRRDPLEKG